MTPTAPEVTHLPPCILCRGVNHIHLETWIVRTLSELNKWAQQNPEAWEALRTGRAAVCSGEDVTICKDRLKVWLGVILQELPRMDKPFKSEVKEGV